MTVYEKTGYMRKVAKKDVDNVTWASPRNGIRCHHRQVVDHRLGVEGEAVPKRTIEGVQQVEGMRGRPNKMAVVM